MNSTLSFNSSADSKNFLKDRVMPVVNKVKDVVTDRRTGKALQVACGAASVATAFSVGWAAPVAGVVCGAAGIQGAFSQ